MPLLDIPFWLRILLLLAFAGAMLIWDAHRHGQTGSRRGEYLFLFAGGLLGSIVGVVNDLITSAISPDYYILGKDIPAGDNFLREVLQLGAQAGFSAGVILAALLLMANSVRRSPSRPPLPIIKLSRRIVWPLAAAFALAILGGCLGAILPFPLFIMDLAELLPLHTGGQRRFLIAWCTHIGLYAGAVLGTIGTMISVFRSRAMFALKHSNQGS